MELGTDKLDVGRVKLEGPDIEGAQEGDAVLHIFLGHRSHIANDNIFGNFA
jgi:hypothetical protein